MRESQRKVKDDRWSEVREMIGRISPRENRNV